MTPTRRQILGAGVSALVVPLLGCHGAPPAGAATAAAAPRREMPRPATPRPTAASAAPPPSVVVQILEANRRYDPRFQHGLSNHLSMAIIALHELGASNARLSEFFERYRTRLEPAPVSHEPITRETFRDHLGTQSRCGDYLAFFEGEIARTGEDGALRAYLPALMPGVAGGAFHPLIRLGYAVHAHDAADVAVSLAYFADAFIRLGDAAPSAATGSAAPLDLLRRIATTPGLAHRPPGDGPIFERLRAIPALPEFAPVSASALAAGDVTLTSIADAAATLYATDPNTASLHVVTATHALRVLSPFIDDAAAANRWLLQAFAATYVAVGTPALSGGDERAHTEAGSMPSWEAIAAAAAASNDEHTITLVYTCREEQSAYARPLYQALAAKKAHVA
jgi:hypothetical protein